MLCYAVLCYAVLSYDMLSYDMLYYVIVHHDVICYTMLYYITSHCKYNTVLCCMTSCRYVAILHHKRIALYAVISCHILFRCVMSRHIVLNCISNLLAKAMCGSAARSSRHTCTHEQHGTHTLARTRTVHLHMHI